MNRETCLTLYENWVQNNILSEGSLSPLFKADKDLYVKIQKIGKKKLPVLCRSQDVDDRLSQITDDVRAGFANGTSEGMLYGLFRYEDMNRPIPLYVGIAGSRGKRGQLSTLFESPRKKPRFDDYDGYHIGDLSTVVLQGHPKIKDYKIPWANSFFENYPINQPDQPQLRFSVYFWGIPWNTNSPSIVPDLGHVSLHLEESLLIEIFSTLFPNDITNRLGVI
jgi:hypothetical protein